MAVKVDSTNQPIQQLQNKSYKKSTGTTQQEDKKMSTTSKVMIGLGAVATAAIASMLVKNAKIARELAEQFGKDKQIIETYVTQKSKNAGKTVEETITNILGKDSKVKPHTYNIVEEYPMISVYRDSGGYKDGAVTINGIVDLKSAKYTPIASASISNQAVGGVRKETSSVKIYSGVVEDLKNKVVQLNIVDPKKKDSIIRLVIISPNSSYTPVQKDLLKLAEHPEKVDQGIIDKIIKFNDVKPIYKEMENGRKIIENVEELFKYENLDYNLILSAIQSMAK